MRINSYEVLPHSASTWRFSPVEFGPLNLIVGDSGSGKTRFLNTVFNAAMAAVHSDRLWAGHWRIGFEHAGTNYTWEIKAGAAGLAESAIEEETLTRHDAGGDTRLVSRSGSEFYFKSEKIPKLSRRSSAIGLLKDEEEIEPVHRAFSLMMRRRFFGDDLKRAYEYQALQAEKHQPDHLSLEEIFRLDASLNARHYFLDRHHGAVRKRIVDSFKVVFPFVEDVKVFDLSRVRPTSAFPGFIPALCMRERHVQDWIPIDDISSGMQKVFMVLSDLYMLPPGSVYLLDEYENSLGISAIDFLPDVLLDLSDHVQFLMTSHHPYIINKIPPEQWYVFHRRGADVHIRYGKTNADRYGRSRQQRFLQLLNDPYYRDGVE